MKNTTQKQMASANTLPCPKCGKAVSKYYFSPVVNKEGKMVPSRCDNCGFWEDPE